jgi:hypothetical protein
MMDRLDNSIQHPVHLSSASLDANAPNSMGLCKGEVVRVGDDSSPTLNEDEMYVLV